MEDSRKSIFLRSIGAALCIVLCAIITTMFKTNGTITITVKKDSQEELLDESSFYDPLAFLLPRAKSGWSYDDEVIVASGKSISYAVTIFELAQGAARYDEKKVALIDVTDDPDNTEIMLEHSFPGIELSGTFPMTKGRKYRFAIYTLLPEIDTEISININGYNKIRSYFANRKS